MWIPFVLAERTELVAALDWTDFDEDDHATLSLSVLTSHGRTTPLLWQTMRKSTLRNRKNLIEDELLQKLRERVPPSVRITIVADRGCGDQQLYAFLRELGMDYIIRFRSNILFTDSSGRTQRAAQWIPKNHRAKKLPNASVTTDQYTVCAVVLIEDRNVQQSWCLATSRTDLSARQVIDLYAKRFTCEETFRDTKNAHLGLGMSQAHIRDPRCRDRLLIICALTMALLTLLGTAGESLGEDRLIKVNTVKYRTHSLFRQGLFYYQAMDAWPIARSARLLARFSRLLCEHSWSKQASGLM